MHTIDVQSIYKKYFYEFPEFLKYFQLNLGVFFLHSSLRVMNIL